MARRHRRRIPHLLTAFALVLAACAGSSQATTTTFPPSTTTGPGYEVGEPLGGIDAEILIPEGEGPFPTVVLVHGGGWISGEPAFIRGLALFLTEAGYLTINTAYQLSSFDNPGYPAAVDDVACAVRNAAVYPQGDGTVTLVGYSAGAQIGALVALTGDRYGADCPVEGSGLPDRFVGLAGPYDTDRIGRAILPFFGDSPTNLPQAWEDGNPRRQTAENPDLKALIVYGDIDRLVHPALAVDFYEGLLEGGVDATLQEVEGAEHSDMSDPEVVGDIILSWLEG
ncbi:MAG: alpha/beta fold hydrolase [Acidimicrobiia bacterium]